MSDWKVTAYHGTGKEWTTKDGKGPFLPHRFEVEGHEGRVEWSRKPDSPAPAVGQVLQGTITPSQNGDFPAKFKQDSQGGGGGRGMSPEDRKSIVRQHSQEMALMYMQAKGITEFRLDDDFRKVVAWFAEDAAS